MISDVIRPARLSDIPAYGAHHRRHGAESGSAGDLIFAPYQDSSFASDDEILDFKQTKWTLPVTAVGWERCWLLAGPEAVHGHLELVHEPPLAASLHRAKLMMGLERSYRGQGWGGRLLETALAWARAHPSLTWVDLYVFAHNEPARRLYRTFGFSETGLKTDQFRVNGQRIDDVSMSLPLERPPPHS